MTQLTLLDDAEEVKEQQKQERLEEEKAELERKRIRDEFKKNYYEGSTTVYKKEGNYYFSGDIEHCGKKAIFHNAKKIRDELIKGSMTFGHMNCNDLPTFDRTQSFEKEEKDRVEVYKDDLYVFVSDFKVKVVNKIKTEGR